MQSFRCPNNPSQAALTAHCHQVGGCCLRSPWGWGFGSGSASAWSETFQQNLNLTACTRAFCDVHLSAVHRGHIGVNCVSVGNSRIFLWDLPFIVRGNFQQGARKMNTVSRITAAAILATFATGAAFAAGEASDPTVKERIELMKGIAGATRALGDMASGKVAFDAAAAESAKAALESAAAQIGTKFETPATDPVSESKPEIWTNWDDFLSHAVALSKISSGIDTSSADGIKASMGQIGATCKSCHSDYRL